MSVNAMGAGSTVGADEVMGRRALRRRDTQAEIVDAAWVLAAAEGLTGWTMRDLGARVGMKAQSLYAYFASKHEIYDAMFHQGYASFRTHMGSGRVDDVVDVATARADAHRFFGFCVEDPVRFQLLFLRTVPGFEPSPAGYAVAVEVLDEMRRTTVRLGVDEDRLDLWTAVMTGLASQQIANDPGGDRWARLVDDAVDMLLEHTVQRR